MVKLLSEGHPVELVEHRLVKLFADPVGLGPLSLGPGMVDILNCQVQLILMTLRCPAVLSPPIRKNSQQRYFVFLKEWKHPVIE